jgi:hypothetical protein
MSHPLSTKSDNETASEDGEARAESSTATVDLISHIQPKRLAGRWMYEDDRDWVDPDLQSGEKGEVEGRDEVPSVDRPGVGGPKRMPVDREEVVRLMLQSLRDVGYQ